MQEDEIVVSEVHVDSDNIVKNENDPLLEMMPAALRSRLQGFCLRTGNYLGAGSHQGNVIHLMFYERLDGDAKCEELLAQSRLHVKLDTNVESVKPGCLTLDEDGDLELSRARTSARVLLDHCPATTLPTVGLQVWKAALVMSDFLLYRGGELLQGKGVVELGSGVGLCGIVAAAFADYVFCTDVGEEVLHLCRRNLDQNEDFYDALTARQCPTKVRCLDWTKGPPEMQTVTGVFPWSAKDLDEFRKAEVFLAADVVYDDCLTDCLFELVLKTITRGSQTIYVALEKRVNFTLEDLDTVSPCHRHFMQWLEKLRELGWKVCVVDLSNVPQYFGSYSRDSYLELWQLRPC